MDHTFSGFTIPCNFCPLPEGSTASPCPPTSSAPCCTWKWNESDQGLLVLPRFPTIHLALRPHQPKIWDGRVTDAPSEKDGHLARGSFPLLFLKMQRNLQNLECPMRRMYFQLLCSSLCYLYEVLESACGHVAQWLPCLTAGHRWPPGFTEFDSGAFSLFLQAESGTELPGETISWIIEWGI